MVQIGWLSFYLIGRYSKSVIDHYFILSSNGMIFFNFSIHTNLYMWFTMNKKNYIHDLLKKIQHNYANKLAAAYINLK